MQAAYFDNYAAAYDSHFTISPTGKAQRELVHNFLRKVSDERKSVLEINAGTGEDAFHLSACFEKWLCSDVSPSMVDICRNKLSSNAKCSVIKSSIQEIEKNVSEKFDVVFSNFGGLNCIGPGEMTAFAKSCSKMINAEGELVFVIMGRKCFWEKFYFRLKGDSAAVKRRMNKEAVPVNVEGTICNTWYYSPDEIEEVFAGYFSVKALRPVGFFIPPSYLNPFCRRHPFLFGFLKRVESLVSRTSWLANHSDHFLIHLKKK